MTSPEEVAASLIEVYHFYPGDLPETDKGWRTWCGLLDQVDLGASHQSPAKLKTARTPPCPACLQARLEAYDRAGT